MRSDEGYFTDRLNTMWHFQRPSQALLDRFLNEQRGLAVRDYAGDLSSFNIDQARIRLGCGDATYSAACQALREWKMFPAAWTHIVPHRPPIEVGQAVAVVARVFGLWWLNACRIVAVIDERQSHRRFGFTYSTLPGHVEMGEETFVIEWDGNDDVWYEIHAISRPNYWAVKLAYPLARWMQHRFRQDSQRSMQQATEGAPRP